MSIIAIITARGGSKRIPRKNIKEFMGKPMLSYAIQSAIDSKVFDEVMVSTDDGEIAEIARNYGAKIPFMRSEKTSNDFAPTADVLSEVLNEYKNSGKIFDEFCCIYPCVPFLNGEILKDAYNKLSSSNADSLMPVVKYSFPIQRAVIKNKNGFLEYREPENAQKRSQDLEPTYHDAGMFYFVKTSSFSEYHSVVTKNTMLYEIDESVAQDIDTIDDWKMAEMKYRILNNV